MTPRMFICFFALFAIYSQPAFSQSIGFNADTDSVERRYSAFIEFLNDRLGIDHEIVVSSSYEEASRKIRNGEVQIAILSPLNYVQTSKHSNIKLLAAVEKNYKRFYGGVVLGNSRTISSIPDIQNSKFFYPSSSSTSGYLMPLFLLSENGIDIKDLNKEHVNGTQLETMKAALGFQNNSIVATSTDRFFRSETKGFVPQNEFYSLFESRREIPFDAIVIAENVPAEIEAKYREAIGVLITMNDSSFKNVFPVENVNITSIWHAADSDYDIVRKMDAQVNGLGIMKMGATKEIDPQTLSDKRRNLRKFQRQLYDKYGLFIEISKIYDTGELEETLHDLNENEIDFAEMPPLQAGRALKSGLLPLGTLTWPDSREVTSYTSMLIRKKGMEFSINYPADVFQKKIAAIGPPSEIMSASGYAFVFHDLNRFGKVKKENILWFKNAFEIVSAVEKGNGEIIGVIGKFHLNRMIKENDMAQEVKIVTGSEVQIPNGAYVLSSEKTKQYKEDPSLKKELVDLLLLNIEHVNPKTMEPGFTTLQPNASTLMSAVYQFVYPRNLSSQIALIFAGILTILSAILFMVFYRLDTEAT